MLRNLANIRGAATLDRFESAATLYRQACLSATPIGGNFDLPHLKEIHRHLFQDVYPWAGETRTINISKGGTMFGSHSFIGSYAAKISARFARERETWRRSVAPVDLPDHLADFMGEINALHPFREGNGRTQRIFIGQLAREFGLKIRWDEMTQAEMIKASIASFAGDNRGLSALIHEHAERH